MRTKFKQYVMNIAIWFVSFQVAVLMLGPTYRNTVPALAPLGAPSPSLHGLPARLFALAGILGARKRIALLRDSMCRFVPRNRALDTEGAVAPELAAEAGARPLRRPTLPLPARSRQATDAA